MNIFENLPLHTCQNFIHKKLTGSEFLPERLLKADKENKRAPLIPREEKKSNILFFKNQMTSDLIYPKEVEEVA